MSKVFRLGRKLVGDSSFLEASPLSSEPRRSLPTAALAMPEGVFISLTRDNNVASGSVVVIKSSRRL